VMGWMFFLAPLIDFILLLTAYLILAPILFGWQATAAWSYPLHAIESDFVVVLKFFGIEVFALIVLGLTGIGRISGVTELCTGAIGILCAAVLVARDTQGFTISAAWPGWLFFVGILAIGIAAQYAIALCVGLLLQTLSDDEEKQKSLGMLIGGPFMLLVSSVPAFVYAAWLAKQFVPNG
jgi:hypothetical protein